MGRVMPTDGARALVVVRAARWAMLMLAASGVWVTSASADPVDLAPGVDLGLSPWRVFGDLNGDRLLDMAYPVARGELGLPGSGDSVAHQFQTAAGGFTEPRLAFLLPDGPADSRVLIADVVEGPANEVVVTSSTDGFGRVYDLATAAPERGPTRASCGVSP